MPYRKLRFVFAIGLCLSLFASSQFTPVAQAATKTFTDVDPNSTSPYAVAIYALAVGAANLRPSASMLASFFA